MNRSLIIRFLISRICSALGDQLLMFAVPLIVYRATESVAMAGMAMFIEWLPRVISLPIAGALSDRVGGWRIYSLADSIRALACTAALGGIIALPNNIYPIVAVLMAICAFFYAQAFIALEATVPLLVETCDMPKAQGFLQSIDQTAMIGGPMAAAMALIWIEPVYLIGIAAGLFIISASFILSLRRLLAKASQTVKQAQRRHFISDLRVGFDVLRSQPFLFALIGLSIFINLIVGLSLASGAALTVGKFGQPDTHFAVLQIGVGVFSLISFAVVPRLMQVFSVFTLGISAYFIIILGGFLMGSANSFPIFVVGFSLSLGLCGMFNIYIRTERVRWIPKPDLGKTISLIVLLNQLSLPASGLMVSTQTNANGVQSLFMYVGGGAVLASLVLLPTILRKTRTLAVNT